jgi:hypothetical protein
MLNFILPFLGSFLGVFVACGILYLITRPSRKQVEQKKNQVKFERMLDDDLKAMRTDKNYQNFKEQTQSWI